MQGLQSLETADLEVALADPHAALREHAVRLSEPHLRDDAILQKVVALAEDPNPRVRMQVAYSLGETKDPRAVDAIARIARRDGGDPWIRMAVLSSVAETSDELLVRLLSDRAFVASSTGAEMAEKLAYIVGVRNRPEEIGKLLDAVTELHGTQDVALQTQIVQGIGDGLKQVNGFLPFDGASQRPGARLLRILLEKAKATAADARQWDGDRIAAIRLLACFAAVFRAPR